MSSNLFQKSDFTFPPVFWNQKSEADSSSHFNNTHSVQTKSFRQVLHLALPVGSFSKYSQTVLLCCLRDKLLSKDVNCPDLEIIKFCQDFFHSLLLLVLSNITSFKRTLCQVENTT